MLEDEELEQSAFDQRTFYGFKWLRWQTARWKVGPFIVHQMFVTLQHPPLEKRLVQLPT